MNDSFASLARFRNYAPFLLRLSFGFQLVYFAQQYIVDAGKMQEFTRYLASLHFPVPPVMAHLAVYAECIGGILMMLGWKTRWAAAVLAFNFTIAVLFAHAVTGDTYAHSYPALHLLAMSIFLLINGPGKPSVDEGP